MARLYTLPPAALSSTVAASIWPFWSTPMGASVPAPAFTNTRSSPLGTNSTSEPAAKEALPPALISPVLTTECAMSVTSPPRALMRPALTMLAIEGPEKSMLPPAMKASLETSRVEATKPLVLMTPPWPTMTPLGLIRNTRPLAARVP